jgi:hypothetical protein
MRIYTISIVTRISDIRRSRALEINWHALLLTPPPKEEAQFDFLIMITVLVSQE